MNEDNLTTEQENALMVSLLFPRPLIWDSNSSNVNRSNRVANKIPLTNKQQNERKRKRLANQSRNKNRKNK